MTRHTHNIEPLGAVLRRVMDGITPASIATIGCAALDDGPPCEPLADDGRGWAEAHTPPHTVPPLWTCKRQGGESIKRHDPFGKARPQF